MYPLTLSGPRVTLREFSPDDTESIHRYAVDPEVVRYMPWGPNTWEQTQSFLTTTIERAQAPDRSEITLAIELDEMIGAIGIRPDGSQRADIGYVLRRDMWGRGIMSEAARVIVGFGFQTLGLHRIWATCDVENVGSARVMEKAGMTREGRMRDHVLQRGRWRDSYLYAILVDEWGG